MSAIRTQLRGITGSSSSEEYSMLSDNSRGKLPKPLQFAAPQRFVTSSLVQALSYIDNLLPGTELEIHTTTSAEAVALRPMIKNVRVLTLPVDSSTP